MPLDEAVIHGSDLTAAEVDVFWNELIPTIARYHLRAEAYWALNDRPVGLTPIEVSTVASDLHRAIEKARELLPTMTDERAWKFFLTRIEEVL